MVFLEKCKKYNVEINESLEEIQASIDKAKDYRGVHYLLEGTVTLTEKSRGKLAQMMDDLREIHRWAMSTADSIFGFLIFASSV